MADDDFKEIKKLTKGKIDNLEKRLNDLAMVNTEIKDLVANALKKVANIDRRYENGNIEEKRAIIGSMFPEFLLFDGTQHRTKRINSAIALICQSSSELKHKKNGTNLSFLDLPQEVNCAGFEPATSALSRQRSKPAELTVRGHKNKDKYGINALFKGKDEAIPICYHRICGLTSKNHHF